MDKKINFYDLRWMMSLFGTAVGAGILFLPIKAGVAGIYPVFVMALLAFPMTYLSHLGLARFVLDKKAILAMLASITLALKSAL